MTLTQAKAELLQLEHVVWSCRDFEEPVPAKVRKRIAALRRAIRRAS